jgi:prolipoprotein diacylglyceryl transferase
MNYFTWAPDPVIFKLGFLQLRWYGLFFVGSFVLGYFLIKKIFIAENKDAKSLDDLLLYTLFGAIAGARVVHCFFYEPEYYLSHIVEILYVWKGGLASHGGMLGVLLVFYIYAKKQKISYMWLLSRMAIPGTLVAASVRFGNFFNSEILGKETHLPWAIVFEKVDNIPRHPVQLYEAFSYLVIFAILWFVYKKTSYKFSTKLLPGLFATLLFSVRFLLEYTKTEQATYSLSIPFTVGQLLSAPFILLGIVWMIWAFKTTPKEDR